MGFADDLLKIKQAGYTSSPNSTAEQILSVISQVPEQVRAQQEKRAKDTADQVKLYSMLREAGYSEEDATERVNRSYRSTEFIQNLLTGKSDNAFQKPTEEDKTSLEKKKTQAEITKLGAETAQKNAQASRLKQLTDTLNTPGTTKQAEQIRKALDSYIKRTYPTIAGGYGTEEEQAAMASDPHVARLEAALNKSLQLPEDTAPAPAAGTEEKIRVERLTDGKKGTIPAKNFDPKKYKKI